MLKIGVFVKFYNNEISPFDESAIECALSEKDKNSDVSVTVIAMAPLSVKEKLEGLTRLNLDAVLISDAAFAGSDTLVTSQVLAKAAKPYNFDLMLFGRQSLNGDTAQVPPETAYLTNTEFIPYVMEFGIDRVKTRLGEREVKLPASMSVERIKTLRFPKIASKKREIKILTNKELLFDKTEVGFSGSPTKVIEVKEKERPQHKCKFIDFSELSDTIKKGLEKKDIHEEIRNDAKLEKVYYVGDKLKEKAESIGDVCVKVDLSDTMSEREQAEYIAEFIEKEGVKVFLFPADLRYRVVAPMVAAKLNSGLAADCIGLKTDGKTLFMIRPAVGGNTIATIESKSKTVLATVRVKENSSSVVFGIGYGAKDKVNEIKTLAERFGATFAASRKAVDAGILPYEKQVGLTGRIIAPKVYVAFGISGAIQHAVGIENAGTVIAVNGDINAKIFDYADYGIIKEI